MGRGTIARGFADLVTISLFALGFAAPAAAAAPGHGRAWELVSNLPPGAPRILNAAAWDFAGDHVVYHTLGPTPGAEGGEVLFQNVATREPGGWSSEPVSVPFAVPEAQLLGTLGLAVDGDFSSWLWGSIDPLVPGGPSRPEMGVYRREPSGELELLAAVGEFEIFSFVQLEALSADLRHAGFDSNQHLLPADDGRLEGRGAYEITSAGLSLAGVDGTGTPLSACGSVWGSGGFLKGTLQRAMSSDGRRGFITSPDPETSGCAEPAQVYLREGAEATRISASRCSRPDCGPGAPARFVGAAADGGRAYFITAQQLVDQDSDEAADLYRYDADDGSLRLVSGGAEAPGAEVVSAAVPVEGERVYFVADGVFAPGEGDPGTANLYLSEGGTVRFIATIPDLELGNAVLSADGSILAFTTFAGLAPADSDGQQDVYRYDARDGSLQDLSLAGLSGNGPFAARIPRPEEFVLPGQRPGQLSGDGERVFFETEEQLLPEDVNEELDLYEWFDGSLGLISSGIGEGDGVAFEGASGDGRTAYFLTKQSLAPQDADGGELDLYAARVDGGFPAATPPPGCVGEGCRTAPSGSLGRPRPATERRWQGARKPPVNGGFRLAPLGPRVRGRLAAGEDARLMVQVPDAGRVSVLALARLHGFESPVGRDRAVAWNPGRVLLSLRLSPSALRQLAARGRLRLQLVVRYSGRRAPLRRKLLLRCVP
ncbi:MAG TPA: hypothetical protein VHI77_10975 [Solirubrobacterales bacterium]|jgi:hypothetical protein|nr:hypothetical protein [Solirubrobacterales bacterium]